MLPVVEKFITEHLHSKPIIVADAAMLDEERLTELREKGLSCIVGARLIQKAEELVARQSLKVKAKFIKRVTKERIGLNTALIEKRNLLLGIKGYCKNNEE